MQSISEFNLRSKHGPFRLAYRHIPGALGTGLSADNGAVCTEEFRMRKSRDRRLAELAADPTIQWAEEVA